MVRRVLLQIVTRHQARQEISSVAARLREAQAERGITNEQLARDIDVSLRLLQKWRAGDVHPRMHNLVLLSRYFDKPLAWFFTESEAA